MENGDVDKLREAVETIWSTMLGLELAPGQPMAYQSNPAQLSDRLHSDHRRLEWSGYRGLCRCSGRKTLPAIMFGIESVRPHPTRSTMPSASW